MQTIKNVKIPYATEGIIRTAQLDDTITPENSVQLAVNMNFDRVGAMQTRPGVTEYADQLSGPVRNFGTLNNNEILDGYENIRKLIITNDFSDPVQDVSIAKVDATHFLVCWSGASQDGFAQVVSVDVDTGIVTKIGSALEYDTSDSKGNKVLRITSAKFILFWSGPSGDGYVQVLDVNASTFAVTTVGSALEFDTSDAPQMSAAQVNSNHFTLLYTDGAALYVSNFEVNTGTWAVTEVGSRLTLDASAPFDLSVVAVGNGTHFLAFWDDTSVNGKAQVYSVNTSTWDSTAIGTPLTFYATPPGLMSCCSMGDGQTFVNAWRGVSSKGIVQVFRVNPSTYAVTTPVSALEFDTVRGTYISNISMEDGSHFTLFWSSSGNDGNCRVYEVNLSTFTIAASSQKKTFDSAVAVQNSAFLIDSSHLINFWDTTTTVPGPVVNSIFQVYGELQYNNYLYAQQSNNTVYNNNAASPGWVLRRATVNSTQKARFAQYLNYIWMVNGGDTFGDPVMTSNGGDFGTDLVPEDFPPGDFISAGFEGRVWVADAGSDTIYYTDIVQFVPPATYTLTYDPEVNFISSLSPQNGQTITGLVQVPRALLVFKQDSIFRIYGATSVDAYPAYNVGTYSQESIVTTKTGIFFHHSSGFYQFDYGGQPVEISRRIIDFVKAIPRSYYPEVKGIYDGFDCVKWYIGSVTVEGVTFSNCTVRFTISTQVWTVYDYVDNDITALIQYDDGTTLNQIMGTEDGLVGALDTGTTDFGEPFYYEYIGRWRSYTDMYANIKSISGFNVYSENAAGANLMYQVQKSGPNVWETIGTVDENNNALLPNDDTEDFDVIRLRLVGNTSGTTVVIHGIEILSITNKGYDQN